MSRPHTGRDKPVFLRLSDDGKIALEELHRESGFRSLTAYVDKLLKHLRSNKKKVDPIVYAQTSKEDIDAD